MCYMLLIIATVCEGADVLPISPEIKRRFSLETAFADSLTFLRKFLMHTDIGTSQRLVWLMGKQGWSRISGVIVKIFPPSDDLLKCRYVIVYTVT